MVFLAATNTVRAVPTTNSVILTESNNFLMFSMNPIFSLGSEVASTASSSVSFFMSVGDSCGADADNIFCIE